MKISERIEEIRSKLIRAVTEANLRSEEEGIDLLERLGLDAESAKKLLDAFRTAESAKNTAKNVWNSALKSKAGIDFSADIEKSRKREFDTRQYFDETASKNALLMLARTLPPNRIDGEILEELYNYGIQEQQINNPALRVCYNYYCKFQENEKAKESDTEKMRNLFSKIKSSVTSLNRRIEELENQNEMLNKAYINLQYEHSKRIVEDEKHYQDALSLIGELKLKVNQLQSRGVFQVMGDKLLGRNKTKRLPRGNSTLPETLYKSKAEKAGVTRIDQDVLGATRTSDDNKQNDKEIEENDQLQQ